MVEINLLPWRDNLRHYQLTVLRRSFLVAIFLGIGLCALIHIFLAYEINKLTLQNALLKQHWQQLTARKMNLQFVAHRDFVLNQLFDNSKQYFLNNQQFFSELENIAPEICLTRIERHNNLIDFFGKARSIADLSNFLLHWPKRYLFSQIKIIEIKHQGDGSVAMVLRATENNHLKF